MYTLFFTHKRLKKYILLLNIACELICLYWLSSLYLKYGLQLTFTWLSSLYVSIACSLPFIGLARYILSIACSLPLLAFIVIY